MVKIQTEQQIWDWLCEVQDPEIPVLSVVDLGVVRQVERLREDSVRVVITPTYSGCPAMDVMAMSIRMKLLEKGFKGVEIITRLSPAWTTDWMSASGKQRLQAYGIAPPQPQQHKGDLFEEDTGIICPHCRSADTQRISQFGATACKALYQCCVCREPFEYFKCHH